MKKQVHQIFQNTFEHDGIYDNLTLCDERSLYPLHSDPLLILHLGGIQRIN